MSIKWCLWKLNERNFRLRMRSSNCTRLSSQIKSCWYVFKNKMTLQRKKKKIWINWWNLCFTLKKRKIIKISLFFYVLFFVLGQITPKRFYRLLGVDFILLYLSLGFVKRLPFEGNSSIPINNLLFINLYIFFNKTCHKFFNKV